jgi:hypothetical protein
MRPVRYLAIASMTVSATLAASPELAHHEAIFGAQSASVLPPGTFLTVQVFSGRFRPSV